MYKLLKQSTAVTLLLGPFLDDTDGKTAETGLTISQADVQLWKQGGTTLAQKNDATACTARTLGYYTCPADATDTNTLGILTVAVHETGALPIRQDYCVVTAQVYDSMVLGSDLLDVQVAGMNAGIITSSVVADDFITAAKIAANAIGASELAADAVTEIQSGLATAAALTVVDDFIDTEVAAIKAVTDKLDTALELDGGVYRYTTNALELAPSAAGSGHELLTSGTAVDGSVNTIELAVSEPTTVDLFFLNGIRIWSGTGIGQSRQIIAYSAARVATVNQPWTVVPDNTSLYEIYSVGVDAATLDEVASTVWDSSRGDHQIAGSFGEFVFSDMIRIDGDAAAAAASESFFDGTGITLTNVILPWSAAWDAEIQSEVQDAIEVNHLDHLLAASYDPTAKPGAGDSLLNAIVENDAGVPRFTVNSLEQAPTGGGPADGSSFTNIPWNAAWDAEVESEVVDGLASATTVTDASLATRTLATADYATATHATAIIADTEDLQSRTPATLDGGRMRVKVEAVVDKVLTVGGSGGFSIGSS